MENLDDAFEIQDDPVLVVTEEMRSYFYDIARWARIMAVVGFVFAGLSIFAAFAMASSAGDPQFGAVVPQYAGMGKVGFALVSLLFAFLLFYPSLLLYKYAVKAKFAVLYFDQNALVGAISKLKSLFQFWGIIALIYVAMQIIITIAVLSSALAAS